MQDLHPQADKLIAYADGKLSKKERAVIKALLANDKSAVEFLQQLKVSDLPFKQAFEFLLEKPPQTELQIVPPSNFTRWLWPTSLVATLLFGLLLGYFSLKTNTEDHDNWIVQVADYHLLYVRETVNNSHLSNTEKATLKTKLENKLQTSLTIPDLSAQKLEFKRGQLLDSNGKTLIQLAYLPDNGLPVALCILRNNEADALPKTGESRGLPYVTWVNNSLSYVIIGRIDKQDLSAAALNALTQMANDT